VRAALPEGAVKVRDRKANKAPRGDPVKGKSPARRRSPGDGAGSGDRMTLAGVSYLNSRPILDPLGRAPYSVAFASSGWFRRKWPAGWRSAKRRSVSFRVAAAATLGDVRFVRGVGIGARGPIRSVLLVSNVPLDQVEASSWICRRGRAPSSCGCSFGRLCKSEPRYLGRSYGKGGPRPQPLRSGRPS